LEVGILFLERAHAKGYSYLYLKKYDARENYANNKIIIYRFGRVQEALKKMYKWRDNFNLFPGELIEEGCTKEDLDIWIKTLETGVHVKTGRMFKMKQTS
jgi:hypothetical protein